MVRVFKRAGRPRWHFKVRLRNGRWQTRSGYIDKRATEALAAEEQARIDRGEVGLADPFEKTRTTPLTDLVADFLKSLRQKGRAEGYVADVGDRLQLFADAMGVRFLSDATPAQVEAFLGRLRRGEDLPPQKRVDKKGAPLPRRPASMRTRDAYVEAFRSFGAWLARSERWSCDPFAKLEKVAGEADRTFEHRAFDVPQLEQLVTAAEVRPVQEYRRAHPQAAQDKLHALAATGWGRGTLYQVAAHCGLRLNECASLCWGDVVLDGDEPHVVVRAVHAKNRREQRMPLMPWVVDRLREHRRRQNEAVVGAGGSILDASATVFDVGRNALDTFRKDARFAGLGDHDEQGRRTTFHGLRASTATLLARAGVSPAVAMRVLRHSDPRLTLRVYAKLDLGDLHRELRAKLAPQVAPNSAPMRAAAGCPAPLAELGNAMADRLEAQQLRAFPPTAAASGRSTPQRGGTGELVGRAGFEPATSTL